MAASAHASRRLVERCFEGTLPASDWEELFAHLRGCPPCREHFERTRVAFRALGGTVSPAAATLSRREAELIREALLPSPARRAGRLRWMPIFAAALAGSVGLAMLMMRPSPEPGGFVERGAEAARRAFDVLCLPAQEEAATVSATAAQGRCAPGSFLKVVVTKPDPELPQVLALALDPAFKVRAIVRVEATGTAPVVAAGHAQLGAGEALVVVAVFSSKPVAEAALVQAVERARSSGAPVKDLRELPLPDTAQLSLRVQATEASDAR